MRTCSGTMTASQHGQLETRRSNLQTSYLSRACERVLVHGSASHSGCSVPPDSSCPSGVQARPKGLLQVSCLSARDGG
ncbi:hypothetical protein RRG08_011284 [Elysia crispata]|uniref:Uncharacterized protein n=1 Tax=Elysia crispata TaxID=231223 RepID=A0AAE0ZPN6_9GAST|nr:hypothetical protein RRG08_011284 [Elysia crispata]